MGLKRSGIGNGVPLPPSLTVSGPHHLRLVVFHSGINNHSAAQAHGLPLGAKGHFEFVGDGCEKGDTVFGGKSICRGGISLKAFDILKYPAKSGRGS